MDRQSEYQLEREDILRRYRREKQTFYLLTPAARQEIRDHYERELAYCNQKHYLPTPYYNKMSVLGKRKYEGYYYPQYQRRPFIRGGVVQTNLTFEQRQRMARMRALAMRKRGMRPFLSANNFPEIKALDIPRGAAGDELGLTAVITPLNLVQVGSSFFNRVGRRIELKSLTLRGIFATLRTVANESIGRILVVYDAQTNGALPAIADLLQTTDQTGANTNTPYSGINMNYRDRFQILRDYQCYLPSFTDTAGVVTNPGYIDNTINFPNFKIHIKLKNLLTQYRADSSPAVIGDIATGGLFMIVFGSLATGTTGWSLFWESRLRFGDK